MAVRNFYATTTTDNGRSIATGPAGKAEGISVRIQQRDHGAIIDALRIEGYALATGELRLQVVDADGNIIHTINTHR